MRWSWINTDRSIESRVRITVSSGEDTPQSLNTTYRPSTRWGEYTDSPVTICKTQARIRAGLIALRFSYLAPVNSLQQLRDFCLQGISFIGPTPVWNLFIKKAQRWGILRQLWDISLAVFRIFFEFARFVLRKWGSLLGCAHIGRDDTNQLH